MKLLRRSLAVLVLAGALAWAAAASVDAALRPCPRGAAHEPGACSPPGPDQLWWAGVLAVLLLAPDLKLEGLDLGFPGIRVKARPRRPDEDGDDATTAQPEAPAGVSPPAPRSPQPAAAAGRLREQLERAIATRSGQRDATAATDRFLAVNGQETGDLGWEQAAALQTLRAHAATLPD